MKRLAKQKGFTLLEVMVAISIFSISAAVMMASMVANTRYLRDAQIKSRAVTAAQGVIDELRFEEISTLPSSGSDPVRDVTIDEYDFEVEVDYCTDVSRCASAEVRQLVVSVFYKDEEIYVIESIFTEF